MPPAAKNPPRELGELLAMLSAEFPDLAWSHARLITQGWDHEVVILDEAMVFRFPNDDDYTASLRHEIAVLAELAAESEIDIPRYTSVARDGRFAGYPIVAGTVIAPAELTAFSSTEHASIAAQLGRFLGLLHGRPISESPYSEIAPSYVVAEQEETREQVERYLPLVLSAADLELVRAIMAEVDELIAEPHPIVLIHGDVYPDHLLWDAERERLGLIDFSDMSLADPAIDFAELHEYGSHFVDEVYAAYDGPRDSSFLERAWTYQRWVGVYLMTDHFVYGKTPFAEARQTFDRVKVARTRPEC